MDQANCTTESVKNKHLSYKERVTIEIRRKDGYSAYRIAKELGRALNTISNELKRGTVEQIKARKKVNIYFAEVGQRKYDENRKNSRPASKYLKCFDFINYVCKQFKERNWSPDSIVGEAKLHNKFSKEDMVSTKTIYNYIDKDLIDIKTIDLPLKLRRSTKPARVRENKKILGTSIDERPAEVDTREVFGHWEVDSVIGQKTGKDNTLVTIVERKVRNSIIIKVPGKTADAVDGAVNSLKIQYGKYFSEIFKSLTLDNGSEFSRISELEKTTETEVYFARPYSSWQRGTNERHNGLIRRFIPKGARIEDFSEEAIFAVEDWMNSLPRKILGYRTPQDMFDEELDKIYKED